MKKRSINGFTLVEVLVTLLISSIYMVSMTLTINNLFALNRKSEIQYYTLIEGEIIKDLLVSLCEQANQHAWKISIQLNDDGFKIYLNNRLVFTKEGLLLEVTSINEFKTSYQLQYIDDISIMKLRDKNIRLLVNHVYYQLEKIIFVIGGVE